MNQTNYSIDREPEICAELIAQAIETILEKDESVISWENPLVVDGQAVTPKQLSLYEIWLTYSDGKTRVNLTNRFYPLTFTGWRT